MVDQAESLCHRITLHFGRLNIETGALYYCITVFELGWNTGLWFVLLRVGSLKSLFCRQCGQNISF